MQLLKGSMSTYLNAWTFPDKTVYPGASTVEKDFFNLFKVYGDAVFAPRLTREVFDQEAHRLEPEGDSGLRLVGVVYNEMRGVYSNPEAAVGRWVHRTLFPDATYGRDSGGDPAFIPRLSYEEFLDYHRRFYHPSNARIFLHGPVPTEKLLAFIDAELLAGFDRAPTDSEVDAPAAWDAPRVIAKTFPVGASDPTARRTSVVLNWRLAEATDGQAVAAFEVIEELLLGNAGSPLRKALVESRLGEDLSPASGLDTELRWPVFSAGLRGTETDRRAAIEALVLESLDHLAAGIPRDGLEAALQRAEFRNREIRRSGGPHALELMRRALRGWLHGAGPETTLAFDPWIREVRRRAPEGYLEGLIRSWLIENPHRSTLVVSPEPGGVEREQEEHAARLRATAAAMGPGRDAARAAERRAARAFPAGARLAGGPRVAPAPGDLRSPAGGRARPARDVGPARRRQPAQARAVRRRHRLPRPRVRARGDPARRPALRPAARPRGDGDGAARAVRTTSSRGTWRWCREGFSARVDTGLSVDGRVGSYLVFRLKALRPNLAAAVDLAAALVQRADLARHRAAHGSRPREPEPLARFGDPGRQPLCGAARGLAHAAFPRAGGGVGRDLAGPVPARPRP